MGEGVLFGLRGEGGGGEERGIGRWYLWGGEI